MGGRALLAAQLTAASELRATILEEIGEKPPFYVVVTLRKELLLVERRIRELLVAEAELAGKIKRAVGAHECKCPECDRWIPSGTILSTRLMGFLKAMADGSVTLPNVTGTEK